jgi:hypothetical protein
LWGYFERCEKKHLDFKEQSACVSTLARQGSSMKGKHDEVQDKRALEVYLLFKLYLSQKVEMLIVWLDLYSIDDLIAQERDGSYNAYAQLNVESNWKSIHGSMQNYCSRFSGSAICPST